MNYIKEMNAFYDRIEQNPLSSSAVALWYALMHMNNKTRWKETFTVSATVLRLKSGLKESSFKRARTELKEKGYIDFESRSHNQAPIYRIMRLTVEAADDMSHLSDQSMDHLGNQGVNQLEDQPKNLEASPLIKQNKKEKKEKENNIITADAFVFYQENFGVASPFVVESLMHWIGDIGEVLVIEAMKRALERNKTSWGYVKSILQAWAKKGIHTVEQVKADEVAFKNSRGRKRATSTTVHTNEIIPGWFEVLKKTERQEPRKKVQVDKGNAEDVRLALEELMQEMGE
ncbi:DnaD domain-containing protein [Oceanobacillus bengalensis]|uniref:DnaD domain protein n=1 Tax=Oceanobacillus bengalensis TaxID=1435466 RepID=A0A494YT44_9BACI|nr:DnaD domain protein [Oceanobacillus bengalensis]RKQ13193.1 DnaD domain protein [Oceanobacillus bengalensis]